MPAGIHDSLSCVVQKIILQFCVDELDPQIVAELLSAVGDHLAAAGHSASIVIVGGSTLALRGWVSRVTVDVDVIAQGRHESERRVLIAPDPLPEALLSAIARVARDYSLPPDWLNTMVGRQWDHGLPEGFADEVEWTQYGGLEVGLAGRRSLIALKLFAAVDRGPESVHIQDLLALAPTSEELSDAAGWVASQDASEAFEAMLGEVVKHVRRGSSGSRRSR